MEIKPLIKWAAGFQTMILCVLSYWLNIIWSFLAKKEAAQAFWFYTCHNATFVEISHVVACITLTGVSATC